GPAVPPRCPARVRALAARGVDTGNAGLGLARARAARPRQQPCAALRLARRCRHRWVDRVPAVLLLLARRRREPPLRVRRDLAVDPLDGGRAHVHPRRRGPGPRRLLGAQLRAGAQPQVRGALGSLDQRLRLRGSARPRVCPRAHALVLRAARGGRSGERSGARGCRPGVESWRLPVPKPDLLTRPGETRVAAGARATTKRVALNALFCTFYSTTFQRPPTPVLRGHDLGRAGPFPKLGAHVPSYGRPETRLKRGVLARVREPTPRAHAGELLMRCGPVPLCGVVVPERPRKQGQIVVHLSQVAEELIRALPRGRKQVRVDDVGLLKVA